jgi:hypothetical protein
MKPERSDLGVQAFLSCEGAINFPLEKVAGLLQSPFGLAL